MLYKKRKRFDDFRSRMGKTLVKIPITPNQWTILSLILAIILFYFLVNQEFLISFFLCIFTISIDMVDGAVARASNKATKFGAYLDTIIDRFIEFFIIFGLLLAGYPSFIFTSQVWLVILFFGSVMSTYSKSAAFEKGLISKEMKGGGILEHTDRLILFLVIIILSYFSKKYAIYLIALTAILTLVSFLQRFRIVTKRYI